MATLNIKNFDDDPYDCLRERAAQQRRSVAQEVAYIIAMTLARSQRQSLLDLEGLGSQIWKDADAAQHVSDEPDS